jgi:SNF2 family DNA or RNA helicase
MKSEFEEMTLRGNAEIGAMMYDSIERFYMSDSEYHDKFGGRNESKQDFVKRVFGGKVNTPKTVAEKIAKEAVTENRYALRGNPSATKARLDEMDALITEHYMVMLKYKM